MGLLKVAFFAAVIIIGANGAPLDELKARHYNDTANITSSSDDGMMTIFAPMEEATALTLDLPDDVSTHKPVPSPVSALSQLSFETPKSEATGVPPQTSVSRTTALKPVVQPSAVSIVTQVTDILSDGTTPAVTLAPSPHLEHSGTVVTQSGADTTRRPGAPKIAHTEILGYELEVPTAGSETTNDQDDGNSETRRPDATFVPYTGVTGVGIVIPIETGRTDGGATFDSHIQVDHDDQQGSPSSSSSNGSKGQQDRVDDEDSSSSGRSDGSTESHSPGSFLVANTPLMPGGSPVTFDGTTYSLAAIGSVVVVNGNSIAFSTNVKGQAVPLETAVDAQSGIATDGSSPTRALSGLSAVSAKGTSIGDDSQATAGTITTTEGARETATSASTTATGTNGNSRETATNTNDEGSDGAESTGTATSGDTPALPSDNGGASSTMMWPVTAIIGAVGLLAAVV